MGGLHQEGHLAQKPKAFDLDLCDPSDELSVITRDDNPDNFMTSHQTLQTQRKKLR